MKLAMLLAKLVGDFIGNEGWGSENEVEGVDSFEFILEGFVGIDREAGRRDPEFCAGENEVLQVVAKQAIDVVDDHYRL